MRKNHQRPTRHDHGAELRAMTLIDATAAGYSLRWNRQRKLLELTKAYTDWRSIREMADYNRRIKYTVLFIARVDAAIKQNSK